MRRNILLLGLALFFGGLAFGLFFNASLNTVASDAPQERVAEVQTTEVEENESPAPLIQESIPVGDSILIEVVDRSTQQVLADADVFVGHELIFLVYAAAFHTDSKGRLHIPVPKGKLLIRGLTSTHAGAKTWENYPADSLVLELDRAFISRQAKRPSTKQRL